MKKSIQERLREAEAHGLSLGMDLAELYRLINRSFTAEQFRAMTSSEVSVFRGAREISSMLTDHEESNYDFGDDQS